MKRTTYAIFEELFKRYSVLDCCKDSVAEAFAMLLGCYQKGKKVLICGNGGSASDSEHIVGELMKSFKKKRALPMVDREKLKAIGKDGEVLAQALDCPMRAIALTSHVALSTAFANDNNPAVGFAQQLYGYGDEGDVLITISTSGNSQNCVYAVELARVIGVKTIALTGKNESKLSSLCECSIRVPEQETYRVQELHLPIYHTLCAMLEEELF